MLQSLLISETADLEKYIEIYRKLGMFASLSYLQESSVYVFYRKQKPDEWLAGYVITAEGPSRYLPLIPVGTLLEVVKKFKIERNDLVEIGGLFIKTRRVTNAERLQVYIQMLWNAYRTGRNIIMTGSFVVKEREKQMKLFPQLIFDEDIDYHGADRNLWIYFGRRDGLAFRFMRAVWQETWPAKAKLIKDHSTFTPLPDLAKST